MPPVHFKKRRRRRGNRPTQWKDENYDEFGDLTQVYGKVNKILGDYRYIVKCEDTHLRICRLRGTFRRRVRVEFGAIVLVSIRNELNTPAPYNKSHDLNGDVKVGDIIQVYSETDIHQLTRSGDLDFLKENDITTDVIFDSTVFDMIESIVDSTMDLTINADSESEDMTP